MQAGVRGIFRGDEAELLELSGKATVQSLPRSLLSLSDGGTSSRGAGGHECAVS